MIACILGPRCSPWNVLVRSRTHPVALVGDLKKAFLQVRIGGADRDALRFHFRQREHSKMRHCDSQEPSLAYHHFPFF